MNIKSALSFGAFQCALLVASGTLSLSAVAATYLEEDGVVIFEVEEANVPGKWIVGSRTAGYTGNGYLEWNGEQRYGAGAAEDGKITYRIRISNPGNYQFRWRNRINRGNQNTEHNDSFLRLPSGANVADEYPIGNWTKVYMNKANTWSWNTGTKDHDWQLIRQYFNAGDHLVQISGRSPGHAIDRIALYKYDEVNFNVGQFDDRPVSRVVDDGDLSGGSSEGGTSETSTNQGDMSNLTSTPAEENINSVVVEIPLAEAVCKGNRLTLAPTVDLYTQAGVVHESESLRFDGNQRKTYLQYDLTGVSSIIDAQLRYSVTTDPGHGELNIDQLAHSTWLAGSASAELPDSVALLATAKGTWARGTRYSTALDAAMIESSASSTQALSLRLSMTPSSNDVMLASSRHTTENAPLLTLTGDAGFCVRYEQSTQEAAIQTSDVALAESENEEISTDEAAVSTGDTAQQVPTEGSTVAAFSNGDSPAENGSSDSNSSSTAEPEEDVAAAAVGGSGLTVLALVAVFLRRKRTAPE